MKYLIILLLLLPLGLISQSDPNLDRRIVGVVKIYLVENRVYQSEVTYYDTSEFKVPALIFDLILKSYITNFPIWKPAQFFEMLNNNLIKYKEYYELTNE